MHADWHSAKFVVILDIRFSILDDLSARRDLISSSRNRHQASRIEHPTSSTENPEYSGSSIEYPGPRIDEPDMLPNIFRWQGRWNLNSVAANICQFIFDVAGNPILLNSASVYSAPQTLQRSVTASQVRCSFSGAVQSKHRKKSECIWLFPSIFPVVIFFCRYPVFLTGKPGGNSSKNYSKHDNRHHIFFGSINNIKD